MKLCMWEADPGLTPGRWAISTDNVDQAGVTILAYATSERFARIIVDSLNEAGHDSTWWENQFNQHS